jgi:hypothetical protein
MTEDGSFYEVAAEAEKVVNAGGTVYFKWTCDACGERASFEEPNSLYIEGVHEDCPVDPGHVTNLEEKGCGFAAVLTFGGPNN